MTTTQTLSLATANGHKVTATLFHPAGEVRGKVLVVSAMGTPQSYYQSFALWLAEQGFLAATFDYSGTGASQVADIRALEVNLVDWARFDTAALVEMLSSLEPNKPLYWIGHSLGGQLLGLSRQSHKVSRAITVASGVGYWLQSPWALRWRVWWLWFFLAPVMTSICGYFPGRKLRKVGDLPRGVMQQWRRWCLTPGYAIAVEGAPIKAGFDAVTTPITALYIRDDQIISRANVNTLMAMYANAPKTDVEVDPAQVETRKIGHFGFFRPRFKESLWEKLILPELA